MTHTPTPWRAIPGETSIWTDINPEDLSSYGLGIMVAETPPPLPSQRGNPSYEERSANAAFIVRAVNCHDDLVAALKEARDFISEERSVRHSSHVVLGGEDGMDPEGAILVSEADARLAQIDAALAKAEQPT